MKAYPCAKVNLGLNVVERRPDGYHNIETVFYPVPLCDELEIESLSDGGNGSNECVFTTSGIQIESKVTDNLVMKAYHLLTKEYPLPPLRIHLHKSIPSQAGMGGGSSDAASMIRLLNEMFHLGLSVTDMQSKAASLGADCAFFIQSKPAFAKGIGDKLSSIDSDLSHLKGLYMAIVKPDVAVSTREAYARITPQQPPRCCFDIVQQPVETWRDALTNDFEGSVFTLFPELAQIKEKLYNAGALFAQMTGSGSAVYALFKEMPEALNRLFPQTFCHITVL